MSECWSCYWGWPAGVAQIYQQAVEALNGREAPLQYGPGHVVWGDENFELAESCLDEFETWRATYQTGAEADWDAEDLAIVHQSLTALAAVPLAERCVAPEAYAGVSPEAFPPPPGVVMIHV